MARHDFTDDLITQGFAALGQRGGAATLYSSGATPVASPRPSPVSRVAVSPDRLIAQLRVALKKALDEQGRLLLEVDRLTKERDAAVASAQSAWAGASRGGSVGEGAIDVTPIEGVYEDDDEFGV